jgi:chromosome segregation ATPase
MSDEQSNGGGQPAEADLRSELERLQAQRDDIKNRADSHKAEVKELRSQLTELKGQIESKADAEAQLEAEKGNTAKLLERLQKQNEDMKAFWIRNASEQGASLRAARGCGCGRRLETAAVGSAKGFAKQL